MELVPSVYNLAVKTSLRILHIHNIDMFIHVFILRTNKYVNIAVYNSVLEFIPRHSSEKIRLKCDLLKVGAYNPPDVNTCPELVLLQSEHTCRFQVDMLSSPFQCHLGRNLHQKEDIILTRSLTKMRGLVCFVKLSLLNQWN